MIFVLTEKGEKKDERLWIWICLCSAWSNNRIVSFKSSENVKGEKMRLIDADALSKLVGEPIEVFLRRLDLKLPPTVDAVEVVRCKDCIHKPRGTRNKHDMEFPDEICPCQCDDYWYSWMPYDDWFCANGERREDETN